jgi:hypothetical protein
MLWKKKAFYQIKKGWSCEITTKILLILVKKVGIPTFANKIFANKTFANGKISLNFHQ